MRQTRKIQLPLMAGWTDHQHSRMLEQISSLLDGQCEILEAVQRDLVGQRRSDTGRNGLSAEQVLRIAVLKRIHQLDYRDLSFHLADSRSFRTFARLAMGETPSFEALQANVKKLSATTLETLNRLLLKQALRDGDEAGKMVRTDSTVVDSAIHLPTDSSLLWDSVRVLSRLMGRLEKAYPGCRFFWHNHRRAAKRQWLQVTYARGEQAEKKRKSGYHQLLRYTERTLVYARKMAGHAAALALYPGEENGAAAALSQELLHYIPLVEKVVSQTRTRVVEGRKVAAKEKVVSLFEPHTDVIVKDRRETRYGHKVTLTSTRANLVVDCVIEEGNPADATLAVRSMERVTDVLGKVPHAASFDGGYTSRANLEQIKALGIVEVAFHKKCRLTVAEMVTSSRVYRRLRNFRAGVEGTISALKRGVGMGKCRWRGLESFKAYVWSCIVTFNLMRLAGMRQRSD